MTYLRINGRHFTVRVAAGTPLLWVIREHLKMTGTKFGCGIGQCGACTVHLSGQPIHSCSFPVEAVGDKDITTIEGINDPVARALQTAWIREEVPQCGYCQSGQIMTATAFLRANPKPTSAEIVSHMTGNICRCGTYLRIKRAIARAAATLNEGQPA